MTTKGIEFKATLNTSEMDAKIQQLQLKLKAIASPTTLGGAARSIYGADSPMTERAQRLQESMNKDKLETIRRESIELEKKAKIEQNTINSINEKLKQSNKLKADHVQLTLQLEQSEKRLSSTYTERMIRDKEYQSITGRLPSMAGGGGPPSGIGGQMAGGGAWGGGAGGGGLIGSLVKSLGAGFIAQKLAEGIQGAANFGAEMYQYPQERAKQQANIAQGAFATSGAGSMLTGQGVKSMFFAQERMRAMQNAQTAQGAMNMKGFGDTLMSATSGGITGAGIGSAIGAGLGFMTPIPGGMAIGAGLGAKLGAGYGSAVGLGSSLMQGQTGAGIKSALSLENPMEGVSRYRAQQFFQDMQANQKAEEEKDPYKQIAYNYMENNRNKFLQAHQVSGMNEQQLYGKGGFLTEAGGMFTTDQKLGAMNEIYGAGGSSVQGRNAGQALQLKRSYGIQGAAGIMGALSGNIGGGQTGADSVTRKILSEAFSVGLDASKFSRETEKFLSISAKFVEQSGARTPEEMAKVAETMSGFVTGNSMKQVESAGAAREFFAQNIGAGGTAYQKALQMSQFRSGEGFSKLSGAQITSLTNMSDADILRGGTEIIAMANKAGMTVEDFQQKALKKKEASITQSPDQEKRRREVKVGMEKYGINFTNEGQVDKAIKEAQIAGDDKKVSELKALQITAGAYMSGMKSELGLGGKESTFVESIASKQFEFNKKKDETFKDTFGIERPVPVQEGNLSTEWDKADAKMSQHELTNAMGYAEQFKSSVEMIASSSVDLAKALAMMSEAIKSGEAGKIKSATEASTNLLSGRGSGRETVKPANGIKNYSGIKN